MNTTGPPLSDGSPTHLADYRFHLPDAAVHETGQRWARCRCATWTYALGLAAARTVAASAATGFRQGPYRQPAYRMISCPPPGLRPALAWRRTGGRRPVGAKVNGWAVSDVAAAQGSWCNMRDGEEADGAARIIIVESVALSV